MWLLVRRLAWFVGVIGVATVILGISILRTTASAISPTPAVSPTPTPIVTIEYYLVYPGILPDHFLYPVKMMRDWVRQTVTFDKVARARLFLLFADKRLNAAKFLIEGNKVELGVTTATKAEKYLERSYMEALEAKNRGEGDGKWWGTLNTAAAKHEEVLAGLSDRVDVEQRAEWGKAIELARMIKEKSGQEVGGLQTQITQKVQITQRADKADREDKA